MNADAAALWASVGGLALALGGLAWVFAGKPNSAPGR